MCNHKIILEAWRDLLLMPQVENDPDLVKRMLATPPQKTALELLLDGQEVNGHMYSRLTASDFPFGPIRRYT